MRPRMLLLTNLVNHILIKGSSPFDLEIIFNRGPERKFNEKYSFPPSHILPGHYCRYKKSNACKRSKCSYGMIKLPMVTNGSPVRNYCPSSPGFYLIIYWHLNSNGYK